MSITMISEAVAAPLACIAVHPSTAKPCGRPCRGEAFFCSLHTKRYPPGGIATKNGVVSRHVVVIRELHGIPYFVDDRHNVYDHLDVIKNRRNPRKIGRWTGDINPDKLPEFSVTLYPTVENLGSTDVSQSRR
jgi:hypothetical protein